MRLVPPVYVKPYVKRQKNDAADAEAIPGSSRPTMRFVAVKGKEQQALGMLFRTRDLLVRQRTQTINALRGHLAEFGIVAPQGPAHVGCLARALEDADGALPALVHELGGLLLGRIAALNGEIAALERRLRASARNPDKIIPGRRPSASLGTGSAPYRGARPTPCHPGLVPGPRRPGEDGACGSAPRISAALRVRAGATVEAIRKCRDA